jgi:hypothetical protein
MQSSLARSIPNLASLSTGSAGASDTTRQMVGLMQKSMEFQAMLADCVEARSRFGVQAATKVEGVKEVARLITDAIKKAA